MKLRSTKIGLSSSSPASRVLLDRSTPLWHYLTKAFQRLCGAGTWPRRRRYSSTILAPFDLRNSCTVSRVAICTRKPRCRGFGDIV
jgi:hypothetical protein